MIWHVTLEFCEPVMADSREEAERFAWENWRKMLSYRDEPSDAGAYAIETAWRGWENAIPWNAPTDAPLKDILATPPSGPAEGER